MPPTFKKKKKKKKFLCLGRYGDKLALGGRGKFSQATLFQKYGVVSTVLSGVLFARFSTVESVSTICSFPLKQEIKERVPLLIYISVIFNTHITHYKSCWTFCAGSYSCTAYFGSLIKFKLEVSRSGGRTCKVVDASFWHC